VSEGSDTGPGDRSCRVTSFRASKNVGPARSGCGFPLGSAAFVDSGMRFRKLLGSPLCAPERQTSGPKDAGQNLTRTTLIDPAVSSLNG
jgi:hypothetical protein